MSRVLLDMSSVTVTLGFPASAINTRSWLQCKLSSVLWTAISSRSAYVGCRLVLLITCTRVLWRIRPYHNEARRISWLNDFAIYICNIYIYIYIYTERERAKKNRLCCMCGMYAAAYEASGRCTVQRACDRISNHELRTVIKTHNSSSKVGSPRIYVLVTGCNGSSLLAAYSFNFKSSAIPAVPNRLFRPCSGVFSGWGVGTASTTMQREPHLFIVL